METLIFLIVVAAIIAWFMRPRPTYDVGKIKRGDTKQQVLALFGKPESVRTPGTFCAEEWCWTVPFKIYATVDFDSEGRVTDTYRSGTPVA